MTSNNRDINVKIKQYSKKIKTTYSVQKLKIKKNIVKDTFTL